MNITDDIRYIGVDDHELDLFEGQYAVENGMAYNSYAVLDDRIAVTDTVEARFEGQWLENLQNALGGRAPDYLIVHHVEPDHSSGIAAFLEKYPSAVVAASQSAFRLLGQFYGLDLAGRQLVVKDGDTLELGSHRLRFFTAPMVHWPEVIMSYDEHDRVLFSADAFGKFGALDYDDPEGWACEARRYYFGIVGKYGPQVQAVLKKLRDLPIDVICPLHGPVLDRDIGYYLATYDTWSSYGVESEGVAVCYTSVYGHTRAAAELLAEELRALGCPKVAVSDLARCDMAEAVEDAFRYGKLVLASTTYDGGLFPIMRDFIGRLAEHNYQNRTVALVENGSWAPAAAKTMRALFDGCKALTFAEPAVTIRSALTDENRAALRDLARALL